MTKAKTGDRIVLTNNMLGAASECRVIDIRGGLYDVYCESGGIGCVYAEDFEVIAPSPGDGPAEWNEMERALSRLYDLMPETHELRPAVRELIEIVRIQRGDEDMDKKVGLRLRGEVGVTLGTWTDAIQEHYAARMRVQSSTVHTTIQNDGIYVYCNAGGEERYVARLSHDGEVLEDYSPIVDALLNGG